MAGIRQKKIRGHLRRHRLIDQWILDHTSIDLVSCLSRHDTYYTRICVHPWSGLNFTNSITPIPRGKTRQKMIQGLLYIYDNWKKQLDSLGQPYYLKIWLFEPRIMKSEVICAIGDAANSYTKFLTETQQEKIFISEKWGASKFHLEKYHWECCTDQEYYFDNHVEESSCYASIHEYKEAVREFARLLKKPHKAVPMNMTGSNITESYIFKKGDIWIGGE